MRKHFLLICLIVPAFSFTGISQSIKPQSESTFANQQKFELLQETEPAGNSNPTIHWIYALDGIPRGSINENLFSKIIFSPGKLSIMEYLLI